MLHNTTLAKTVYKLGGLLGKIQTPRRVYKVIFSKDDDSFTTEKAGRRWLPCKASLRLLTLSMSLDPEHWDHWALQHDADCNATPCEDCGGSICGPTIL